MSTAEHHLPDPATVAHPLGDPLGEVLHLLKLAGTFYCQAELSAPWGIEVPRIEDMLAFLVVTEGCAWIEIPGQPPQPIGKGELVLLTALGVGACVAAAGLIGFVGLVVPHLVRLLLGADHRRVLPVSMLLGASLLLLADVGARLLIAPAELPLGIITALLGAPFFLALLMRAQRRGGV